MGKPSRPMRMRPASVLRLLRLLALLTARLLPSLERLRRARPFLTHLRDRSASLIWKLLMPEMLAKRALEGHIHTVQAEIDAMLGAAKNAEEKSKKAMVDAARLADELRAEQDHATGQAAAKKSLE